MKRLNNKKGITLIALVITIILLLILAGVVLSLTIGEHGIINLAKNAESTYQNASENEIRDLDKLYSSIKIANGSTITLTQEELDEYIKTKVSPTGIKTDSYIKDTYKNNGTYSNITTSSFTRTQPDENNKITQYLSYSSEDGYTVLKSGWYFVRIYCYVNGGNPASDVGTYFCINGVIVAQVRAWAKVSNVNEDSDSFPIFLKEGDKVHFMSGGNLTASNRNSETYIYPMF